MNDVNFHIENIKRSIDVLARYDLSKKETSEAIMGLIQYPNFQTLFNMKLESKVIHERELCELIGLKRGSVDIAHHVFQVNDQWVMNKQGDFLIDTYPDRTLGNYHSGYPIPVFVFRIVEKDDDVYLGKDVSACVVGLMKPGGDLVYKVRFVMHRDMSSTTMVNILATLAPDFKVFSTKL
jgi:hypothetical protein